MANTYVQIGSTVTVGVGGAASVDFTSIPGTYTDLKIVHSLRRTSTAGGNVDYVTVALNSDTTAANYPTRMLLGNGSTAGSYANSTQRFAGDITNANATANIFGNGEIYIPNYTSSVFKTFSIDSVAENNATATELGIVTIVWNNTSAITSITLSSNNGGVYQQYSTATLYGIKKN